MKSYTRYSNDPRIITLKFDSVCRETGEILKKGTQAVYYPLDKTVYSLDSKQAYEFKCWKADIQMGHNY